MSNSNFDKISALNSAEGWVAVIVTAAGESSYEHVSAFAHYQGGDGASGYGGLIWLGGKFVAADTVAGFVCYAKVGDLPAEVKPPSPQGISRMIREKRDPLAKG